MGPVVGTLWHREHRDSTPDLTDDAALDEAALNTIAYVVSRYGGLTGSDLIRLSHSEAPWQTANSSRMAHTSIRIELSAIREHFAQQRNEDDNEPLLDAVMLKQFLAMAEPAKARAAQRGPDSMEAIAARLAALPA
jgi:hypothetical protein